MPKETNSKLVLTLVKTSGGSASLRIMIAMGTQSNSLPGSLPMFDVKELALSCKPGAVDDVQLKDLPRMLPQSCQGVMGINENG